jgi:hypothetical protein
MTAPVQIGKVRFERGQIATFGPNLGRSLLHLGVAEFAERAPDGPPVDKMIHKAEVTK